MVMMMTRKVVTIMKIKIDSQSIVYNEQQYVNWQQRTGTQTYCPAMSIVFAKLGKYVGNLEEKAIIISIIKYQHHFHHRFYCQAQKN